MGYFLQPLHDWLNRREDLVSRLLADGPLYERDLVNLSQGILTRGSVYLTLYLMEARGLVACETRRNLAPGRPPRRFYRLASAGAQADYARAPLSHVRRHLVTRAA